MRFVQAGVMVLGTAIYVIVFLIFSNDGGLTYYNVEPFLWTAVGWNALLLIVTILVIIDSVKKLRAGNTRELTTGVLIVKLAAIPFFVITFGVLTLLALAGSLVWLFGGFALQAAAVIGAGLAYLAMLSTSVYGWAAIAQLRRERRIDRVLVAVYAVPLGVFVVDIVVGLLLFVEYRRGTRLAAADSARVAQLTESPETAEVLGS